MFSAGPLTVTGGVVCSIPSSGKGNDRDDVRAKDCPTVPAAKDTSTVNDPQPFAIGQAVQRKGGRAKTAKALGKCDTLTVILH